MNIEIQIESIDKLAIKEVLYAYLKNMIMHLELGNRYLHICKEEFWSYNKRAQ